MVLRSLVDGLLDFGGTMIWKIRGRRIPPYHVIKRVNIKKYAREKNISVMIETGTYMGRMIHKTKNFFEQIYSIEIDEQLHKKAKEKFIANDHINLILGDSGEKLSEVLTTIDDPVLFWLDGHYCGGFTGEGEMVTPIRKELDAVKAFEENKSMRNNVILIDDARLFNGTNDYPKLEEVLDYAKKEFPHYSVSVSEDIIRIS